MTNILPKDWETLKNIAQNIINGIDILNMNDDDYIMFGTSLAILNPVITEYFKLDDETGQPTAKSVVAEQVELIQADLIEDIKEELKATKKYLKMFNQIGDRDYLQMSYDRTTHCQKFIALAKQQNINVDNYVHHLKELHEEISKL